MPAKCVQVADVGGEERDLPGTELSCCGYKLWQLAVVGTLYGRAQRGGGSQVDGGAHARGDIVECIQATDCGVGFAVGAVKRDRDRVKQLHHALRVLEQRDTRGKQRQPQSLRLEQPGNGGPFRVYQWLAAGDQYLAGSERCKGRQQLRN